MQWQKIQSTYFEDDILISVAEGRAERVRGVGGGGSVQHHGSLRRVEEARHALPLAVGRHVDRRHAPLPRPLQSQRELASVVPAAETVSDVSTRGGVAGRMLFVVSSTHLLLLLPLVPLLTNVATSYHNHTYVHNKILRRSMCLTC